MVLGVVFAVAASLLWLAIFGYLLLLLVVARRRDLPPAPAAALPPVTILLVVRNEEGLIDAKLDDLERTLYPPDCIRVMVVDGGSTDRTVDLVRARITAGFAGELLEVPTATAKSDQIDVALQAVQTEIVVTTDADARLAPDCVRLLVGALVAEPRLGAVAAAVEPATALLEEGLHWRMQNLFWWAEGASFDAAMGSGVALAFRRSAVPSLPHGVSADDVYIMRRAAERGGARLCRAARAVELRAPQSFAELFAFRRRRGAHYRRQLDVWDPDPTAPRAARGVWTLRRWHFRILPWLIAATVTSGALALFTAAWSLVIAVSAFFALSLSLVARHAFGKGRPAYVLLPTALRALAVDFSVLLRPGRARRGGSLETR